MLSIQFPAPAFQIRKVDEHEEIFDSTRKRWVLLTPEEWVRQNFIAYLVHEKQIPASLIGVEKEIKVGELRKRFDIAVYKNDGLPWLLIECKALEVNLTGKTISQTLSYLSELPCPYIIITNGSFSYAWKITETGFVPLDDFPEYKTALSV